MYLLTSRVRLVVGRTCSKRTLRKSPTSLARRSIAGIRVKVRLTKYRKKKKKGHFTALIFVVSYYRIYFYLSHSLSFRLRSRFDPSPTGRPAASRYERVTFYRGSESLPVRNARTASYL